MIDVGYNITCRRPRIGVNFLQRGHTTRTLATYWRSEGIQMSRQLLLMRHAKSDWKDSTLNDKERPLNSRGRTAAPVMAKWLIQHDHVPDLVLCSSAIRTQQTLDLMIQHWTTMKQVDAALALPQVIIEEPLYLASDLAILRTARDCGTVESKRCIIMLGHNPGMEILASKLSGNTIRMPTGAIAILVSDSPDGDWPADWEDANLWKWRGLVKPRELSSETI